jgi:hypothetical protein
MLNENKNIDRLFREKLGEYEKTPQMFVWSNIQGKLNAHRMERRIIIMKTVGIAAAIVVAFLAGWWMTNTSEKGIILQNRIAVQKDFIREVDPSSTKDIGGSEKLSVTTEQVASNTSEIIPKAHPKTTPSLSSLATFAASTSFIRDADPSIVEKPGDMELIDSEKEFIDELHPDFKIVKKLADWIAATKKDSATITKSNSKVLINDSFKLPASESTIATAFNKPGKNNGRWSLKAEFVPVFNGQAQNNGRSGNLFYGSTPNYKPQETTTENTISGGMVAGYKIGKRLVVKSGFIYNSIRQTTHNVDIAGANPFYNISGNATLASTPSGFVDLNRIVGNTQSDPISGISGNQLSSSYTKYSATNDLKQEIKFIEIPVHVTYKLIDKYWSYGWNQH